LRGSTLIALASCALSPVTAPFTSSLSIASRLFAAAVLDLWQAERRSATPIEIATAWG
jgi:hypothetical protein